MPSRLVCRCDPGRGQQPTQALQRERAGQDAQQIAAGIQDRRCDRYGWNPGGCPDVRDRRDVGGAGLDDALIVVPVSETLAHDSRVQAVGEQDPIRTNDEDAGEVGVSLLNGLDLCLQLLPVAGRGRPAYGLLFGCRPKDAQAVPQSVRHRLCGQGDETLFALQASRLLRLQALADAQDARHGRGEQTDQQEPQDQATPKTAPTLALVILHRHSSRPR